MSTRLELISELQIVANQALNMHLGGTGVESGFLTRLAHAFRPLEGLAVPVRSGVVFGRICRKLRDSGLNQFRRLENAVRSNTPLVEGVAAVYTDLFNCQTEVGNGGVPFTFDTRSLPHFEKAMRDFPHNVKPSLNRICQEISTATGVNLALLNGSYGTLDYKLGWSDLDLFIVLDGHTLCSVERLRTLRRTSLDVARKVYNFNILQLHGVFYSSSTDLFNYLPSFLPKPCFENAILIRSREKLIPARFNQQCVEFDRRRYFLEDIIGSSLDLLKESQPRSILEDVLLIHRLYGFPFAFLQCLGRETYKRESFKAIRDFEGVLPGIADFYESVNLFYEQWTPVESKTVTVRHHLSRVFNGRLLNRICLRFETEILDQVMKFTNEAVQKGWFNQFGEYLQASRRYVQGLKQKR